MVITLIRNKVRMLNAQIEVYLWLKQNRSMGLGNKEVNLTDKFINTSCFSVTSYSEIESLIACKLKSLLNHRWSYSHVLFCSLAILITIIYSFLDNIFHLLICEYLLLTLRNRIDKNMKTRQLSCSNVR